MPLIFTFFFFLFLLHLVNAVFSLPVMGLFTPDVCVRRLRTLVILPIDHLLMRVECSHSTWRTISTAILLSNLR